MTMLRRKPGAEPEADVPLAPETSARRAPAVQANLDAADGVLAELENEVAELVLAAIERKPGAAERLASQRERVDAARRAADELRAALDLAKRLDRQADAQAAVRMRADQFAAFKDHVSNREKAMKRALESAADMAGAFADFAVASEAMVGVLPVGTAFPVMTMGHNGLSGNLLSSCEKLILAELYGLGGTKNGRRAPLPFAKPQVIALRDIPAEIPPGIEVLQAAHQAMLRDIEAQVAKLDAEQMNAATNGKAA